MGRYYFRDRGKDGKSLTRQEIAYTHNITLRRVCVIVAVEKQ